MQSGLSSSVFNYQLHLLCGKREKNAKQVIRSDRAEWWENLHDYKNYRMSIIFRIYILRSAIKIVVVFDRTGHKNSKQPK